jgi:histidinol-phosphate aminotransferase
MIEVRKFIRKHVLDMPAYEPILPLDVLTEELGIPQEELVKLDANENPYGTLPVVREALAELNTAHIYPDPESRQLRRLLAAFHKIAEESIVIGAGSDELIDLIMRIFIEPGDTLLNCPPTFGMYVQDGALNQAQVVNIYRKEDFSLDLNAIKKAVEEKKPKLLFIANPNNPDGSVISSETFEKLIKLPLILVMDEAYIQFSDKGSTVINKVSSYDNLIVLRTFSKSAGMAGLRVGYGVFPEPINQMIMKIKQPYNVSVSGEKAACAAIENYALVDERIDKIINQRAVLFRELKSISWLKPYPSQTNFILCKVEGRNASEVKQQLRQRGILIRLMDTPEIQNHIRVSVGTPLQVKELIRALKEME